MKHIVFDFDGTIADSMSILIELGNGMAEKYGYPKVDESNIRHLSTLPIAERCRLLGIPLYRVPALAVEAIARYRSFIHLLKPIDGIREVIFRLKEEGYKLAILSSNSEANIRQFLQSYSMNCFESISSSRGIFGKHVSLKHIMKKMKIPRGELIYIGDELRDVEACRKARIQMIAVSWGFDSIELIKRSQPDFIAEHPSEIVDLVHSL